MSLMEMISTFELQDTALNCFPNRDQSKTVNRCLEAERHVGDGSGNKMIKATQQWG